MNLSSSWTNSTNSTSNFCLQYLNIRKETKLETNLKLTAYTIAFVLAIIGNSLVIAIILRKSRLKTTTNMFIMNMAVSDIMMALMCMPSSMLTIANHYSPEMVVTGAIGLALCKLMPFLQGWAITVSVLTRLSLSADRYLAIVYPFHLYISRNKAKLLLACVWIAGSLVPSPMLYAMRLDKHNVCIERWEPYFDTAKASKDYTIVMFVLIYAMPLVMITFMYSALIKELWRSVHSNKTVAFSENKAVLKMLVTVIIIFAVCWLPIHVSTFLLMFANDPSIKRCGINPLVLFIGWFVGHVNSAINPIIYFKFNQRFQHEFMRWIKSIKGVCRKKEPRSTASFVKPRIIVTQFTASQAASPGISNNNFDDENGAITINL